MPRSKKKVPTEATEPTTTDAQEKAPAKPAKKKRRSPTAASRKATTKGTPTAAQGDRDNPLTTLMAAAGEEAAATEAFVATRRDDGHPRTAPWNRIEVQRGHNPRHSFEDIEDLAASIDAQGLIQPLTVKSNPDKPGRYLVVAGERRWRAVGLLVEKGKLPEDHPVLISVRDDLNDQAARLAALVENLQRSDLTPLEEAGALVGLREPPYKLSAQKLANLIGKSRRYVLGRLQLLRLAEPVREALNSGEISYVIARPLGNLPESLQREALAHYRTAHPQMRTEEGIRNWITSRAIPLERAIFDPELYITTHKGSIYEGEGGKRYSLDTDLFYRLQQEEVEALKERLGERYEWVEVVNAYGLPAAYERDPKGPGAVIVIRYNLIDIEVIEGVRPATPVKATAAVPSAPSGAHRPEAASEPGTAAATALPEETDEDGDEAEPIEAAPEPTAALPEAPAFVKAPTKRRCAVAARHRNRALQAAVLGSPETALRLAIAGMLANSYVAAPLRGASVGVHLQKPPHDQMPELAPELESALGSLAGFLGLGKSAEDLLSVPAYNLRETDVYEKLLRAALPQLERMHRALVALTVGAWYPSARDATPASPKLLVRVAADLDVEVTDWRPSEDYFGEYTTAELRAIGEDLGLELPKPAKKKELIDALLASDRLNRYTPPELSFRAPA